MQQIAPNDEHYLVYVQKENADKASLNCSHLIEQAIDENGPYSLEDILYELREGKAQLWLVMSNRQIKAIVVTVIKEFPQAKVCSVWLCAGSEVQKWLHLLTQIEDWAKAHKCHAISVSGRSGWEKILADYQKKNVILQKVLR